jgi:hypothetical protein
MAGAATLARLDRRRWIIELFHKILKSGCHAEESRPCTTQRLTDVIALLCIRAGEFSGSP